MTKILLSAAAALAIGLPAAAHAQQANILIVDSDRIMSDCTACKSAASSCKGMNDCKGKGWVESSEKECKAKKGTVVTEK